MWVHDISLPCRYAAYMEEWGKCTGNLILVQSSMGSFENPHTLRAFLLGDTSNYVSSTELFSSTFHKPWSTVSKLKDIKPLWSFQIFSRIIYFLLCRAYVLSQQFHFLVRSFLRHLISIEVLEIIQLRDWITCMSAVFRNCTCPFWINWAGDKFYCFFSPPALSKCNKSTLTDLLGTCSA